MSTRSQWIPLLPLGVVLALHAWVTGNAIPAASLSLILIAGTALRWKWVVSRSGDNSLLVVSLLVGFLLGNYLPFRESLGSARGVLAPLAPRLALAGLLAAALRRFLQSPAGGEGATLALLLGSLVACASLRHHPVYSIVVSLFSVAALATLAVSRPVPLVWKALPAARKAASVIALTAIAPVSVGLGLLLPWAYARLVQNIGIWQRPETSGFSDRIELGGKVDLAESAQIVLYLQGGPVDYLRGATWQRYVRGEWRPWPEKGTATPIASSHSPASHVVLRPAVASPHYFLPLEARQVLAEAPEVWADAAGMLRAPWGEQAGDIGFELGPRDRFAVSPPSALDVEIPETLRPTLETLAQSWVAEESDTKARLRALERKLQTEYTWSLHHRRSTRGDPVVDFLVHHRVGHCEYFATAMALLARSLGIPTRVVGGYRVLEHNPIGNYYIVRQYHAHAWVEAWLPSEGWRTYDPTPAAAVAANKPASTPWLSAVLDLWSSGLLIRWLTEPRHLWSVGTALSLVALFVFRKRIARLWQRFKSTSAPEAGDGPFPAFSELLERLAALGVTKLPAEPLEKFANRLQSSDQLGGDVPEVILRYARLRYGDEGDPVQISRELQRVVQALSKGPSER